MGRIRTLKPDVLTDPSVSTLPPNAWQLFVGAYLLADDAGRCPASVGFLAGQIFHSNGVKPNAVESALISLESAELVTIYEARGARFLEIVGWCVEGSLTFQRIDRPSPAKYPAPTSVDSTNDRRSIVEGSKIDRRLREGKGREGKRDEAAEALSLFPKPPNPVEQGDQLAIDLAIAAVTEINRYAGTKYAPDTASTVKDCRALAKAKHTTDDVRRVIGAKWIEWNANEKMRPQFKPSVLLRPSNFGRYLEDVRATNGSSTNGRRMVAPAADEIVIDGKVYAVPGGAS